MSVPLVYLCAGDETGCATDEARRIRLDEGILGSEQVVHRVRQPQHCLRERHLVGGREPHEGFVPDLSLVEDHRGVLQTERFVLVTGG